MLALGPVLIVTVIVLVSCETYWSLKHLVPLVAPIFSLRWWLHFLWIGFLCVNGLFNYFLCVLTDPGTQKSKVYGDLVYAAALEGALTEADWEHYAEQHNRLERMPRRRRTNESRIIERSWIDRAPYDWGLCKYTKGPKAPRSHYDHVTKTLVLNMDHYCPWMFNVVGYANYRYFVLFLLYVSVACFYGCVMTLFPFLALVNKDSQFQRPPNRAAKSAVTFTFVLAASVGVAVAILAVWHFFLVATAQTTIEFYGNHTLRQRAKHRGTTFRNPYDRGSLKLNWQHVFGPRHPLLAILPSTRKPPAKPWPDDKTKTTLSRPEFIV